MSMWQISQTTWSFVITASSIKPGVCLNILSNLISGCLKIPNTYICTLLVPQFNTLSGPRGFHDVNIG